MEELEIIFWILSFYYVPNLFWSTLGQNSTLKLEPFFSAVHHWALENAVIVSWCCPRCRHCMGCWASHLGSAQTAPYKGSWVGSVNKDHLVSSDTLALCLLESSIYVSSSVILTLMNTLVISMFWICLSMNHIFLAVSFFKFKNCAHQ